MLRQDGLLCPHHIDERPDRNSTNQPGNVPDAAALKSAYGSRHRASRQCGAATDRFRLSKRRCAVPAINAYAGGDTGWSHAIRHGVPMLVPLLAFSQRQWQHRAGLSFLQPMFFVRHIQGWKPLLPTVFELPRAGCWSPRYRLASQAPHGR